MSKTLTCCITFDFDAMSSWISAVPHCNSSMISRGEFGAVAIERILSLLKKYNVRSSFATPGHTIYAYPRLVKRIYEAGHEITHHGWVHEDPAKLELNQEKEVLEKGIEAIETITKVAPVGYRSPSWSLSLSTLTLLSEYGFLYDSSCMGHDIYPYYLRSDDSWTKNEPYQFGNILDLVEIPVSWSLDDFPYSEYVPGFLQGLRPASEIEELWRADFEYALQHAVDGVFTLTLHPQSVGRGNRMMMLERLLDYFSSYNEVQFSTMQDYVTRWKRCNRLEKWVTENADFVGHYALGQGTDSDE